MIKHMKYLKRSFLQIIFRNLRGLIAPIKFCMHVLIYVMNEMADIATLFSTKEKTALFAVYLFSFFPFVCFIFVPSLPFF